MAAIDTIVFTLSRAADLAARGGEEAVATAPPVTKTKWTKVILTREEVERELSVPQCNRPFPTLTEEQLAAVESVRGVEYRDSLREHFIRGAELYYSSRQSLLRAREEMRREVEAKGYAERYMLVDATNDDDDVPAGGEDDDDVAVSGATGDITHGRAKL